MLLDWHHLRGHTGDVGPHLPVVGVWLRAGGAACPRHSLPADGLSEASLEVLAVQLFPKRCLTGSLGLPRLRSLAQLQATLNSLVLQGLVLLRSPAHAVMAFLSSEGQNLWGTVVVSRINLAHFVKNQLVEALAGVVLLVRHTSALLAQHKASAQPHDIVKLLCGLVEKARANLTPLFVQELHRNKPCPAWWAGLFYPEKEGGCRATSRRAPSHCLCAPLASLHKSQPARRRGCSPRP